MQMREKEGKVGKSQNAMFFQWFVASEGRKVGSLKRRVRSHLARREMKNCTLLWREAHFLVKMCKAHHARTTFGSCDVEKVHAVVAWSTFRSQNIQSTPCSDHFWKLRCRKSARRCGAKHISSQHVKNTPCSDHFWKLRCRKSARHCGAKHISKSTCTKHSGFGPLLEVQMSLRMAGARDCAPCQKWAKREGFCSIFNYNHHYTTLHSNTLHYTTTTPSLHSTTLHSTTLHCTQLHSNTLHYTTLHYTTLHYNTLHYITLHYLPLHFATLHYTTLHNTTTTTTQLHSTTLHYTKLHSTTLNYTPLH